MWKLFIVPALLFLSGCVSAAAPMVSDYNGRTVKVQFHSFPLGEDYRGSPIYAKAVETCRLDGRDDAVYQGMRLVGEYAGEHTFLCI